MEAALASAPVLQFPPPANVGVPPTPTYTPPPYTPPPATTRRRRPRRPRPYRAADDGAPDDGPADRRPVRQPDHHRWTDTDSGAEHGPDTAGIPRPRQRRRSAITGLVLPTHDDPVPRGASRIVGGPVGRHARIGGRGWWTPLRVLLLFAVLISIAGWGQKATCRDTRNWTHEYQYTRLCYSDVKALYDSAGFTQGKRPYLDTPFEYPVLLGAAVQAAASVADLQPPVANVSGHYTFDRRSATFYDVSALLLALAVCVTVACTAMSAGARPWDAALVALAPALVWHLTTNWDMFAVAFAAAGLLAWARRRPGLAGVLIGLGAATKLYPVLLLLPLLVLCVRAGQLRAWVRTTAAAVVTALLVYVPFYVTAASFALRQGQLVKVPHSSAWYALTNGSLGNALSALAFHHDGGINGTLRFFQLNTQRPADWDSLAFALQFFTGHTFDTGALGLATSAIFIVLFGAITWLGLSAPHRPRLAQLAFLTIVAFLLSNKVFSPQYVLWLIPLYALARPRWWPFLVWQLSEFLLLVFRYLHFVNLDNSNKGAPRAWFVGSVCIRDLVLVGLAALIVRDIWWPQHDVVRRTTGADDPLGGVLDGAPDVVGGRSVRAPAPLPA